MPFMSYVSSESEVMSNFSFVELEQFYQEAILVLGELQEKKLLKKLPDDISSRIVGLLQQYSKVEEKEATTGGCLEFDTRRDGAVVPTDSYTSSDIPDSIWRGNVEVKGLFRGQKFLKNYCIAHGKRLSFFAGSKKKPLKAQMVLSPAARIEIVPDGKKMGNVYSISELAYPVVTIKFPSVEEGMTWHEGYKSSLLSQTSVEDDVVFPEDEDDGLLYEALEEVEDYTPNTDSLGGGRSTGELSKSVSFVSQDVSGSMTRSDSRHSQLSENSLSKGSPVLSSQISETSLTPPPPTDMIKEEDKIAKLDEDIPSYWGEFSYDQVYQTEWSFNLSQTVLPGKNLLSLKRGQMVLVKERVNPDWWKAVDCEGHEGFIAACFLSLAFEL